MEVIQEMIFSGNLLAWIVLILLLIILIKLLKSAGKGLFLFAVFCALVFVLAKFFPGVAEPIAEFIRGGWLGE
ncbi:MAG: hypothetical protein ACPG3X_08130 [Opitutales bacterium]